ncbi:MAG: 3-phosphoserine/phosphohydroxythreonine transaminase, partial [Oscillospiraceae bacterium]
AAKFGKVNIIASTKDDNFTCIPDVDSLSYSENASYVHICENNTIYGTRFNKLPQPAGIPLVADMSSCIMSRPCDVSKYGVIYFGVQKNVAPAGMAVAIVREDLLGNAADNVPAMLNYKTLIDEKSMYNTPPCYTIYMMGLVLKWIENDIGGLANMEKLNNEKAAILYDYLDSQSFYKAPVRKCDRSIMNVTFTSPSAELDKKFCEMTTAEGLVNLKGHRSVGGMRASIYNAMPKSGVEKLVELMRKFAKENA